MINKLVVQVLFAARNRRALGSAPADYDSNADNYLPTGGLRTDQPLVAEALTPHRGMRVVLTRNLHKDCRVYTSVAAQALTRAALG